MHPRPMTPTSRRVLRSVVVLIPSRQLRARWTRDDLEGRGARRSAQDGVDDAGGIAAVFAAVCSVDLVVDVVVGVHEAHVFVDAACADVPLIAIPRTTEPSAGAPVDGSDVEIVAVADDPDRHRLSQRAVASQGRDLQLVRSRDPTELIARPSVHGSTLARNPSPLFIAWWHPPPASSRGVLPVCAGV